MTAKGAQFAKQETALPNLTPDLMRQLLPLWGVAFVAGFVVMVFH